MPASLRVKPLVRSREGHRIAERASRAFLNARVRQSYKRKQELGTRSREMREELSTTLAGEDLDKVVGLCGEAAEKTFQRTKEIHLRKLGSLLERGKSKGIRSA